MTPGGSLTGIDAQLRLDPYEPNDNLAQAELLTPGTYTDRIQYAEGDVDWHKVYVPQGKDLRFSTTNCRIFYPDPAYDDIDISIRDASGNLIGFAQSARSEETVYAANLNAGYYYVVLEYSTACLYDMIIDVGDLNIGEITGRVTNSQGQGVQNIPVKFYPENDSTWDAQLYDAYTDASGYYHFAFTPGNYKAQFMTPDLRTAIPSDLYVMGGWFYKDTTDFTKAQPLTIVANQTLSGIDAVYDDGAVITGHVTDNLGNPVQGQPVAAYDQYGNGLAAAYTGPTGDNTIPGIFVEDGTCRVRFQFNPGNQALEWYNDKASFGVADLVSIQPRQTTSGINAQLAPQGRIQGQVTDGANPIPGIQVQAYDTTQTLRVMATALTDGNGNYSVRLLPTANIRLLFFANGTNFASEWYNDKASFETSDSVAVTSGGTVNNINAVLVQGGSVSGIVTDSRTGTLLNGIRVELWTATNQFYQWASTNASGVYTFSGVAAGDYKLYFARVNRWFQPEWYNNKADFASADTITVTAGQALTGRSAALTSIGRVQGRVTNLSAVGIQNVTVQVRDSNNQTVGSDTTDSMGYYYIFAVPEGTYWLYFDGTAAGYASEYYSDKLTFAAGDTTTVTAWQWTRHVDAQLAAGGGITGRVTGPGSAGIQNIGVQIKDIYGNNVVQPLTDSNGDYSSGALAAGAYRVFFSNNGLDFVSEWYSDRYTLQTASDVTVIAGSTTSNVNAQLDASGTISGTVTDGSAGVSGVRVELYDTYFNSAGPMTMTDASGNYALRAIPAGNYKVLFNTSAPAANVIREWYNDKSTAPAADTITVTAGGTLSGINAVLAAGGATISGRVTNAGGLGLRNVQVRAELQGYELSTVYAVSTGIDGTYTLRGVPAGTYYILFSPSGAPGNYARELYNDVVPKGWVWTGTPVVLTYGAVLTGIDAVLETCGWIKGRVTNGAGAGIANVQVRTHDAVTNERVDTGPKTDGAGYYAIGGVRPGQYKIFFSASESAGGQYAAEFYNNKLSLPTADAVTVIADQTTAGIDAGLAAGTSGGTIAGHVRDYQGNPIRGAGIHLFSLDGSGTLLVDISTDDDGAFSLGGLVPASYKLLAQVPGIGVVEWYSDKTSYATADSIAVTAGQSTTADVYLGDSGTLTLTAPNGGETLNVGQGFSITWTSSGTLGNVKLEYTADGGTGWTTIIASTENDGSYSWTVPNTPSTNCLVRVSDVDGNPWDVSNAVFTIGTVVQPTITVISLNGGESLTVGTAHNITWSSTGVVGNIKIEYSIDSGSHYSEVVASTANDGSFSWAVPNTPSTTCLVRVSETDGSPSDTSNGVFIIGAATPTLTSGLAVDFGAVGFWVWQNYVWTQHSGLNPTSLAAADVDGEGADEIAAGFGTTGVWLLDGMSWTQLSGVNADGLIAADVDADGADEIVGDFGATGLWLWNGGVWTQMSGVNADGMIAANVDPAAGQEIVADFGSVGLWLWKGGAWTQLSGVNAQGMAAGHLDADAEEEVAVDFGALGIWMYNAGAWSQISGANAEQIVAANVTVDTGDELVVDFGAIGVWLWDNGSWVQILGGNPEQIIAASCDLDVELEIAADWGGNGLWLWNNGVWTKLSNVNPENIIAKH